LLENGVVMAEHKLAAHNLGPTVIRLPQADTSSRLTWDRPEVPTLVRYTADGGLTWTTLDLDVTGGELAVDLGPSIDGWLSGGDGYFEVLYGR
jgi:hypothetical protein